MTLPTVASVVTSGLSSYPTVYYDRVACDWLHSNLFLYDACESKTMPDRSGVAMQIFNYTKFGANTTAVTEGTPYSGQALTQNIRTINLSQYSDYVSYSDQVVLTTISDVVTEGAEQLGYRGALSVDTVISTAVDTAANSDSATRIEINDGSYMTASISRKAAYGLRGSDVKPKSNGLFMGLLPAVMAFDMVNDTAAGGYIDLTKYAAPTVNENLSPTKIRIGVVGGVEWFETNSLPSETNWQSSAHAGYHAYVFGLGAFYQSSLMTTKLGQKNFSVKTSRFAPGSNSLDPAGLITAASSYNFFYGVSKTPYTVNKFRRIRGESSIG